MKKTLIKMVCLIVVLSLSFTCLFYGNAVTSYTDLVVEDKGFVLYSQTCPDEVVDYAVDSYERFVRTSIESGSISSQNTISLGTPFSVFSSDADTDVYYFPIVGDKDFVGTFRVFYDNVSQKYTGIMSPALAEELNGLYMSSKNNDSYIIYAKDEKSVVIEKNADLIQSNTFLSTIQTNQTYTLHKINPLNLISTIEINAGQPNYYVGNSNYLNLNIVETQGDRSWCAAYATATIIRYLEGNERTPVARDIMELFYDSPTNTDSITESNVLQAAQEYGYSPTRITTTLGSTAAFTEIYNRRPVYMRLRRTADDGYVYHAIVLRGYNKTSNIYSIWNPWYEYFENIDIASKQYTPTTSSRVYTWVGTTYDW